MSIGYKNLHGTYIIARNKVFIFPQISQIITKKNRFVKFVSFVGKIKKTNHLKLTQLKKNSPKT